MERCHGRYRVHIAGQNVQKLSELAGCFPVTIMAGDTANFLNGGPRWRRQSLDWALFHVEHGYRNVWQRYDRALRQRNAALRSNAPSIQVVAWDRELVDAAESLDQLRRNYLIDLEPHVQTELESLLPGRTLTIRYISGWKKDVALHAAMKKTLHKDLAQGYSHCGPHRADIALLVDGRHVKSNYSRGQQKTITLALMIGQMKLQRSLNAPRGAFLLDDLGSELDEEYQLRILSCLKEIGIQIFVTVIDTHTINLAAWSAIKRFHVEHGVIHEVL
jgi:DNA replication and repair protein RecF